MKRKILPLLLLSLLLSSLKINAETIISDKDGTLVVFKGVIHCKDILIKNKNKCTANVEIPKGNGVLGWRNWIKKQYEEHSPYLKIKRGKVKFINGKKHCIIEKFLLVK